MKYTSIAKKSFTEELIEERSMTPLVKHLGRHEFTMELFEYENGSYAIEWDVPDLDETVLIGIWVYPNTKTVSDYDGVFELSEEAVSLLEENGFNCEEVK